MTSVNVEKFSGMAPLIPDVKLAEHMASYAANCKFDSGSLEPYKGGTPVVSSPTGTMSAYKYGNTWLFSPNRRQYVESVIPNDPYQRIFFSDGSSYPKQRAGNAEYALGLPRPGVPNFTEVIQGDMSVLVLVQDVSYVLSFVDGFGIEGPPSLPTPSREIGKDFSIRFNLTNVKVTGPYFLNSAARIRIYRSNTGSSGIAIYQFLADVPYSAVDYVDNKLSADLQEELITADWVGPPDLDTSKYPDGPLASMVSYPGGILAGHSGSAVYFAVPGVPTAWPYSYVLPYSIVGMAVVQAGLLVCTEVRPYLLVGSDPSAMSIVNIESSEGCVSADSIVDMGDYAVYASPRGLVAVEGNATTMITEGIISKTQWAGFSPATIRGFKYGSTYIGFYGAASAGTGFVYDPGNDDHSGSFVYLTGNNAAGGFYEATTGALYLIPPGSSPVVYSFDSGSTAVSYTWRSKDFLLPDPVAFLAIRVYADSYPVSVTVISDGVPRGPYSVTSDKPVIIPGGYRTSRLYLTVSATSRVHGVGIASTMEELA